jgi:hypothetical protein
MTPTFLQTAGKFAKLFSISAILGLSLTHCGGGGGGGSKDTKNNGIAPQSLEGVTVDLFGSVRFKFSRLAGVRGNESGAAEYSLLQQQFQLGDPGTSTVGGVRITITNPNQLKNVKYTYIKTGLDTGKIKISYTSSQAFPSFQQATATNTLVDEKVGEIFWGGSEFADPDLELDILFVDNGATIRTSTTRVRSAYRYFSRWVIPALPAVPKAEAVIEAIVFDSSTSIFSLNGSFLTASYDPYATLNATTPSSGVWTSLQGRTINLFNNNNAIVTIGKIAHNGTGTTGPSIPGATPDEFGRVLVDSTPESVIGSQGSYSYKRVGGPVAKLAVDYTKTVSGATIPVNLVYTLTFETSDGGSYTNGIGGSGRFSQDTRTNF